MVSLFAYSTQSAFKQHVISRAINLSSKNGCAVLWPEFILRLISFVDLLVFLVSSFSLTSFPNDCLCESDCSNTDSTRSYPYRKIIIMIVVPAYAAEQH